MDSRGERLQRGTQVSPRRQRAHQAVQYQSGRQMDRNVRDQSPNGAGVPCQRATTGSSPPERLLRRLAADESRLTNCRPKGSNTMSPRDFTKCTTATLAVAGCLFVASGVRADDQREATESTALYVSWYAPCHPALDRGVCASHSQPAAKSVSGSFAEQKVAIDQDFASEPCHPSRDRGACTRTNQVSDVAK